MVAAVMMLAGCSGSGSTAVAPKPVPPVAGARVLFRHPTSLLHSTGRLNVNGQPRRHFASYYACPFKGAIEYVSDEFNNVVYVYTGKFAGQSPCGLIASSSLLNPSGLYVAIATHDLYVANWGGSNILVFHQRATTPYNTYSDPTLQDPYDVTVTSDGIVIASNEEAKRGIGKGSLSTWIGGPNGGTFVGNFPMTNDDFGLDLTLKRNGTVFFDDVDSTTGIGALWKVACPAGACGAQTQVANVSFEDPGGMDFDSTDHLLVNDSSASRVDSFVLPNPQPSTVRLPCCPIGMAIDDLHQHWFTTGLSYAAEYLYPSFTLVGTVPGQNGAMFGVAVDP